MLLSSALFLRMPTGLSFGDDLGDVSSCANPTVPGRRIAACVDSVAAPGNGLLLFSPLSSQSAAPLTGELPLIVWSLSMSSGRPHSDDAEGGET